MQPVPLFPLEVTAVHAVVLLEVANDRLNRLASFELLPALLADALTLTPVHDGHIRVLCIHPPVAQIDKGR